LRRARGPSYSGERWQRSRRSRHSGWAVTSHGPPDASTIAGLPTVTFHCDQGKEREGSAMRIVGGVLVAVVLLVGASAARAQDTPKPVVYNHLTNASAGMDPLVHATYDDAFTIVDFADRDGIYVPPPTSCMDPSPRRLTRVCRLPARWWSSSSSRRRARHAPGDCCLQRAPVGSGGPRDPPPLALHSGPPERAARGGDGRPGVQLAVRYCRPPLMAAAHRCCSSVNRSP